MLFTKVFERFVAESPVSVMFRGTLEVTLSPERLDRLFEQTARRQYASELLFSTCADLLALVVAKIQPSVHAAYRQRAEDVGVSVKALYDKLAGIEPAVCERLVRDTAADLTSVIRQLKAQRKGPLPGYDVRIVDGNHLAATQHRLKELRPLGAGALPGLALVVLDPQTELLCEVITCEDGHANERTLLPRLLDHVQSGQCWIGDRNFLTFPFVRGIQARQAYFLIRQHGQVKGELVGHPRRLGRIETGVVFEQTFRIPDEAGRPWAIRRVTVKLTKATRDGEQEIHLLTNLPPEVNGCTIAEAYRTRWRIENAFLDLAVTLRSEIDTLAYPDAALFGFCLGLLLFNVLSAVKAACRAAHPSLDKQHRKLSTYYLTSEISGVWKGMAIAIPDTAWTAQFASLTPSTLADVLLQLATKVRIQHYFTNPLPKTKPRTKRKTNRSGHHVATERLLQQRIVARE